MSACLDRQTADTLFLASTSLAELLFGIAILPAGRRRSGLDVAMSDLIARVFGPRVLPFDRDAAHEYATLVSRARAAGYIISVPDGQRFASECLAMNPDNRMSSEAKASALPAASIP
jgi:predicted nucleic acid-binding protein